MADDAHNQAVVPVDAQANAGDVDTGANAGAFGVRNSVHNVDSSVGLQGESLIDLDAALGRHFTTLRGQIASVLEQATRERLDNVEHRMGDIRSMLELVLRNQRKIMAGMGMVEGSVPSLAFDSRGTRTATEQGLSTLTTCTHANRCDPTNDGSRRRRHMETEPDQEHHHKKQKQGHLASAAATTPTRFLDSPESESEDSLETFDDWRRKRSIVEAIHRTETSTTRTHAVAVDTQAYQSSINTDVLSRTRTDNNAIPVVIAAPLQSNALHNHISAPHGGRLCSRTTALVLLSRPTTVATLFLPSLRQRPTPIVTLTEHRLPDGGKD